MQKQLSRPVDMHLSVEEPENHFEAMETDDSPARKKRNRSPTKTTINGTADMAKVIEPLQTNQATVIGPAQMAPKGAVLHSHASAGKRKRTKKRLRTSEPPPVKALDQSVEFGGDTAPTTESLMHLLVQGLQSNDRRMLDTVLQKGDDKFVSNTIDSLPLECIAPLLKELQRLLYYKGSNNLKYMKWLEKLIQSKLSFILTLPNLEAELGPLLDLLNARTEVFDRLLRLKGRLNLMMSQVNTREVRNVQNEPLLRYQEESSSEDESSSEEEISGLFDDEEMEDGASYDEQDADQDEDFDEEDDEDSEEENSANELDQTAADEASSDESS